MTDTTPENDLVPVIDPEVAISSLTRRVSRVFRKRRVALFAMLSAPVGWLLVIYIGSLLMLVATAFFKLKGIRVTSELTGENVQESFSNAAFARTVWRSVVVATGVTALCLAIALPMAFYIAKVVKRRFRRSLIVAVLLPLWAGYLVKAYSWRAMLSTGSEYGATDSGGFLQSVFGWSPGLGTVGVIITLAYMWLPYMVLPIYAGFDRLAPSLLDASSDLGARPWRTFRSVIAPLLVPSIAAGSIFTFSLSLGDYITPNIVGGKVQLVGNLIARILLAPNEPLAAAITFWPMAIIVAYLIGMARLKAFESL